MSIQLWIDFMPRLAVALLPLTLVATPAMQNTARSTDSPLCKRQIALDAIQQQIAATRTFDNQLQRISVLIRAADLLWPYQQSNAKDAFLEAFDLAAQHYKETGDEPRRLGKFHVTEVPDQRYVVISAYAKHDAMAARRLSEQFLQDEQREAANKPSSDVEQLKRTGEKVLGIAFELASDEPLAAVNFAKSSFRFPATVRLAFFLFTLAGVNQGIADRFYEDAIAAYAQAPMDQFLYLSAYPFGNSRDAGELPGYTIYHIPEGFTPNVRLQRLFAQTLLARARLQLSKPVETPSSDVLSDAAQIWLALTRLEKQLQKFLPDLSQAILAARENLFALLSEGSQQRVSRITNDDNPPMRSFDEQLETAMKLPDVGRRDQQLSFAVTRASSRESVEHVVKAIDKISDTNVRDALLNWFYFFRAQSLIGDKRLDEARFLAGKVAELDQRAYLYSRIAELSLKASADQIQAREMLDEIAEAAEKAPKTIVTSRTLLALAYLYATIDANRGIEALGNAVKSINRLESPDFSVTYVFMKIEGATFGTYATFQTPGFSPENAFREIGKIDFDGALSQASTLSDKSLRALTSLALFEPCLQHSSFEKSRKPKILG